MFLGCFWNVLSPECFFLGSSSVGYHIMGDGWGRFMKLFVALDRGLDGFGAPWVCKLRGKGWCNHKGLHHMPDTSIHILHSRDFEGYGFEPYQSKAGEERALVHNVCCGLCLDRKNKFVLRWLNLELNCFCNVQSNTAWLACRTKTAPRSSKITADAFSPGPKSYDEMASTASGRGKTHTLLP